MSDYELISQELCVLCTDIFDISLERVENNLNTPICILIEPLNAITFLYFILEISRKYHVVLSNEMIEKCTKWSLKDYADILQKCS